MPRLPPALNTAAPSRRSNARYGIAVVEARERLAFGGPLSCDRRVTGGCRDAIAGVQYVDGSSESVFPVEVDGSEHLLELELQLVQYRDRDRETGPPTREESRHRAAAAPDRIGQALHRVELARDLAPHERHPADRDVHLVVDAPEVDDGPLGPPHARHHASRAQIGRAHV